MLVFSFSFFLWTFPLCQNAPQRPEFCSTLLSYYPIWKILRYTKGQWTGWFTWNANFTKGNGGGDMVGVVTKYFNCISYPNFRQGGMRCSISVTKNIKSKYLRKTGKIFQLYFQAQSGGRDDMRESRKVARMSLALKALHSKKNKMIVG